MTIANYTQITKNNAFCLETGKKTQKTTNNTHFAQKQGVLHALFGQTKKQSLGRTTKGRKENNSRFYISWL